MGRTKRIRKQRQQLALEQEQTNDERFQTDLHKYLSSLSWHNATKLTARNFPLTGRGLCSKSVVIEKEAEIIRLPIDTLLTIKTLENDEDFKNIFNIEKFDKNHKISFQALMAFYVLQQKLLQQKSKYKSYIKSLPNYFTTPYFCPVPELQCLPDSILERTVEQNRKIKESYQNLKLIYKFDDFDIKYTLSDFRWSYFVVNSRSVYIFAKQIKPEKCFFQPVIAEDCNLALAPFLDLFNHSDLVHTRADLIRNSKTKDLEFILTLENSPSKVLPLQQIFISYGALTNLRLLVEYGFILPSNRNDYFEFSLNDVETFLQQEKSFKKLIFHKNKFKFIREHNLHDQMFIHKEEGISHNLHVVLHLLFKEESYFPNILNQVAFGSSDDLLSVDDEVKLFIEFKIKEYDNFVISLENSKQNLTKSGLVCKSYLKETLKYLNICLINLNNK